MISSFLKWAIRSDEIPPTSKNLMSVLYTCGESELRVNFIQTVEHRICHIDIFN